MKKYVATSLSEFLNESTKNITIGDFKYVMDFLINIIQTKILKIYLFM